MNLIFTREQLSYFMPMLFLLKIDRINEFWTQKKCQNMTF